MVRGVRGYGAEVYHEVSTLDLETIRSHAGYVLLNKVLALFVGHR